MSSIRCSLDHRPGHVLEALSELVECMGALGGQREGVHDPAAGWGGGNSWGHRVGHIGNSVRTPNESM
jgi:hypothetical protein